MPENIQSVQQQIPPAAETTWLEGIAEISSAQTPQGPVLLIRLSNNHRYALPLFGAIREAVHRIASPIAIASEMPHNNGDGMQLPGN